MVAGVRRAREPQHRPRCLARSRRFRWPGGASVGRAIVRGRCGALKSTVASFRRVVMFDLQHGAKSCRARSLALCPPAFFQTGRARAQCAPGAHGHAA